MCPFPCLTVQHGVPSREPRPVPRPRPKFIPCPSLGHAADSEIGRIVATWGSGDDGQLGHGDTRERDTPQVVLALMGKDINLVSCGGDHCVASSSSRRESYSWGWGDFGRLGHAQADDVWTPKPVRGLSGLTLAQVACGDMHTLAVTTEGAVYAFGRNQAGQLGIPSQYDALEPTRVVALQVGEAGGGRVERRRGFCVGTGPPLGRKIGARGRPEHGAVGVVHGMAGARGNWP